METPLLVHTHTKQPVAVSRIAVLLTFAAVVLFVVTLSTPALIHTSGFGPVKTEKLTGDFGPFRVCYSVANKNDCETINNDCEFPLTVLGDATASVTTNIPVVDDCKSWNASRAFLVLATFGAAAALLVQVTIICTASTSGIARFMSCGLGIAAAVAGIISMAILIDRRDHDDAFTSANSVTWAYGFYLLISGWILILLAAIPFAGSK